jgi:hypothetical protein
MTVSAVEFMRRFLMHILPSKFVKIRHYGLATVIKQKSCYAKGLPTRSSFPKLKRHHWNLFASCSTEMCRFVPFVVSKTFRLVAYRHLLQLNLIPSNPLPVWGGGSYTLFNKISHSLLLRLCPSRFLLHF